MPCAGPSPGPARSWHPNSTRDHYRRHQRTRALGRSERDSKDKDGPQFAVTPEAWSGFLAYAARS
ncbi:DUF397 domain-containing protein [Streptomyces sp. SS8]